MTHSPETAGDNNEEDWFTVNAISNQIEYKLFAQEAPMMNSADTPEERCFRAAE